MPRGLGGVLHHSASGPDLDAEWWACCANGHGHKRSLRQTWQSPSDLGRSRHNRPSSSIERDARALPYGLEPVQRLHAARVALLWPSGGGAWRNACLAGKSSRALPTGGHGEATRRAGSVCPHSCVITRCGPASTPRSSKPAPAMAPPRIPSFFIGLRANSSRRGPCRDFEQALRAMPFNVFAQSSSPYA
jgi:hypothetical protein